jgi:hypothetical protein
MENLRDLILSLSLTKDEQEKKEVKSNENLLKLYGP